MLADQLSHDLSRERGLTAQQRFPLPDPRAKGDLDPVNVGSGDVLKPIERGQLLDQVGTGPITIREGPRWRDRCHDRVKYQSVLEELSAAK